MNLCKLLTLASIASIISLAGCTRKPVDNGGGGEPEPSSKLPEVGGMVLFSQYGTLPEAGGSDIVIYDFTNAVLHKPSATWGIKNPVNAVFSTDGRQVIFMAQGAATRSWDIYLYEVTSGGQPRNLTLDGAAQDKHPRFSPDGDRIVFTRNGQLAVITLASGAIEVLTDDAAADFSTPCYNSTGTKIVYVKGSGAESSIGLYDVAAKTTQTLYPSTGLTVSHPVTSDSGSFFFNSVVSSSNSREQVYKGYFDGRAAEKMASNTDNAAYADASQVEDDLILLSNTRSGSAGGYDLSILDTATDRFYNLNDYLKGVNSSKQEKFGSYNANTVVISENPGNGGETEKTATISVNPTSLSFINTGAADKTIAVTSNIDAWEVMVKAGGEEWCSAVKTKIDNKYVVVVSVEDNDGSERNTQINISFGEASAVVAVTQYGKTPVLELDKGTYQVSYESQNLEISLTTNLDYAVSIEGTPAWISYLEGGDYPQAAIFAIERNEGETQRTATLHFTNAEEGIDVVATVIQSVFVDPTKTFNVCGNTADRPLDTYSEFHSDGRPKLYGKLIFHNYSSYGASNPSGCWEYDFWTGKLRKLNGDWSGLTVNPMNVHWAPDGKHICFMGYNDGWKIYLWDVANELPVKIGDGEDPKFSYDSRHIVWKRSGVLYEYDLDTKETTRLTPSSMGSDFHIPYYLPDDEKVVYCTDASEQAIWVFDKTTQSREKVADLVGTDYYPIGRDSRSFYFSAHTKDNVSTVAADQMWMGFYDKSAPQYFPWNTGADTSDACYVNQDWVMVCSTRRVNGVSQGGYDYYIAKVTDAKASEIWNLNLYTDTANRINTELEELGASYLPSRLMFNSGEWAQTGDGVYWN